MLKKRAENYRKQFLARIAQYQKLASQSGRQKRKSQLQRDHKRLVAKLKPFKFAVPKLVGALER